MDIKPIQTQYNGYLFRSRLEARWAVLFDELNIEYEYEPEGYDLGEYGWYLPDFYLPERQWYVEIKGSLEKDETGIEKARYLDNDPPGDAKGCLIFSGLEYAKHKCDAEGPDFNNAYIQAQCIMPMLSLNRFNKAITKARQARF